MWDWKCVTKIECYIVQHITTRGVKERTTSSAEYASVCTSNFCLFEKKPAMLKRRAYTHQYKMVL